MKFLSEGKGKCRKTYRCQSCFKTGGNRGMGCETSLLLLFTHINRLNRYWQLHAGCFHFCSAEKGWHKINPHVDLIGQHQPFFFFNCCGQSVRTNNKFTLWHLHPLLFIQPVFLLSGCPSSPNTTRILPGLTLITLMMHKRTRCRTLFVLRSFKLFSQHSKLCWLS